jgi:hypothetical protein
MRKEDLKVGYVVEFNNEYLAMVLPSCTDEKCISGEKTWFDVNQLNNDLRYSDYYVTKVYGLAMNSDAHRLSGARRELLWKRPKQIIEITLEEIAKLKGCNVDQIRIKE